MYNKVAYAVDKTNGVLFPFAYGSAGPRKSCFRARLTNPGSNKRLHMGNYLILNIKKKADTRGMEVWFLFNAKLIGGCVGSVVSKRFFFYAYRRLILFWF